jgi:hypothetical protein
MSEINDGRSGREFTSISLSTDMRKKLKLMKIEEGVSSYDELLRNKIED